MVSIALVLCLVYCLVSFLHVELVGAAASRVKSQAPSHPNDKLPEIESRLKRDVEMDRNRCNKTGWGEAYATLHRRLLASPTGKRLVAVPHLSGMADRIVGFTTGLTLAIITDRAFQMGRRSQLRGFEEAFHQPNINWTRPADPEWVMAPLARKIVPNQYNESVLASKLYYAVNTVENVPMEDALGTTDAHQYMGGDAQTTMLVTNRGKTIRLSTSPRYKQRFDSMGLNAMTTFGCLVNYVMQPKSEIFLPVYDQFDKMSSLDPQVLKISIQIRTGDSTWSGAHAAQTSEALLHSYHRFFACAKQIETFVLAANTTKYSSVLWYLATDSIALRHAAVAHYKDKIVTSLQATLEHSSKELAVCRPEPGVECHVSANGFTNAAAEWWMLGYADYHVITQASGFGRSGAYRTLRAERIYTVHRTPKQCGVNDFTRHLSMATDWAGI